MKMRIIRPNTKNSFNSHKRNINENLKDMLKTPQGRCSLAKSLMEKHPESKAFKAWEGMAKKNCQE